MKFAGIGRILKLTWKSRLFLWLHDLFHRLDQWFLDHCDYKEGD